MILFDVSEEFDILLTNGMFRNRNTREDGVPISGSNADFRYDDEEYREYAKIIGVNPLEVNHGS
jgi:hypothetical protein